MPSLRSFLRATLLDRDKASYSRVFALPFLAGSFALSMADGIVSLCQSKSALDAAASLALIGLSLFTGSKALSLRGQALDLTNANTPPSTPPTEPDAAAPTTKSE